VAVGKYVPICRVFTALHTTLHRCGQHDPPIVLSVP
jgi:hypothetical protein